MCNVCGWWWGGGVSCLWSCGDPTEPYSPSSAAYTSGEGPVGIPSPPSPSPSLPPLFPHTPIEPSHAPIYLPSHRSVGGGRAFEGDVDMARRVEGLMMLYGAIVQVCVKGVGVEEVWRA